MAGTILQPVLGRHPAGPGRRDGNPADRGLVDPECTRRGGQIGQARRVRYATLAHAISFVGLTLLTGLLRNDEAGPSPRSGIWAVAWAASGVSALAFWAAAAFPHGAAGMRAWYAAVALAAGSAAGVVTAAIGRISAEFWYPLSRSTLWVVHRLLSLVYPDPIYLPADLIVGTGSFAVRVEPECSGYEGIGLILTFLAAYLWFARSDYLFPRSFLLLPLGALAMWLANAIRLALLVSVGTSVSPDVAERGFHSHAGWLALNGVGLGMVFATRRLRFFTSDRLATGRSRAPNPTAAYLAPLAAILAVSLLTGAFTVGFDGLYPTPRAGGVRRPLGLPGRLCRDAPDLVVAGGGDRGRGIPAVDGPGTGDERRRRRGDVGGGPGGALPGRGRRLAGLPRSGFGGQRTAGRGAGVSRLPDASADRRRLRECAARPVHLVLFPHFLGLVRGPTRPLGRRDAGRDAVRVRHLSARRTRRFGARSRHHQRPDRCLRPGDGFVVALGLTGHPHELAHGSASAEPASLRAWNLPLVSFRLWPNAALVRRVELGALGAGRLRGETSSLSPTRG